MGFRFRKSVKVAPGVRLNLSKSGVSTSIGGKGATVNLSSKGTRTTVGVPGTGISHSSFTPKSSSTSASGKGADDDLDSQGALGCGCLLLLGLFLIIGMCSGSDGDELELEEEIAASEVQAFAGSEVGTNAGEEVDKPESSPPVEAIDEEYYVTANSLNGRTEPSTASSVVKKMSYGAKIKATGRRDGWLRVTDGILTYWISSSYVSANRPRPRRTTPRPRRSFSSSCPCSGRNVCIGPRGGRYCITSGGNKRYGV